jgi:hypothetical protein
MRNGSFRKGKNAKYTKHENGAPKWGKRRMNDKGC